MEAEGKRIGNKDKISDDSDQRCLQPWNILLQEIIILRQKLICKSSLFLSFLLQLGKQVWLSQDKTRSVVRMEWDFYFHGMDPSCLLYYVWALLLVKCIKCKNRQKVVLVIDLGIAIRSSSDVQSSGFLNYCLAVTRLLRMIWSE